MVCNDGRTVGTNESGEGFYDRLGPLGAIEVEAKALEFGLQFAKDLSIHEFTLESDLQTLINALMDLSAPRLRLLLWCIVLWLLRTLFAPWTSLLLGVRAIGQPTF